MPLNLLTNQYMQPQSVDMQAVQGNAIANQMGELKLQDAMQSMQARNRLTQLMQQPGMVDPQTGAPSAQALSGAMQIDPEMAMQLYQQRARAEDYAAQAQERQAQAQERRKRLAFDRMRPIVDSYYKELEKFPGNPELALDKAKQEAIDAEKHGWDVDGSLREAGITEEQHQRALQEIDKWTPNTMERWRSAIETDPMMMKLKAQAEHEAGVERRFERSLAERGSGQEKWQIKDVMDPATQQPKTVRINPATGEVVPVEGVSPARSGEGRMYEERAAMQYNTMKLANEELSGLEKRGISKMPIAAEIVFSGDGTVSAVGRFGIKRALTDDEQQLVTAAQLWAEAGGHLERGANLTDQQFHRVIREFIPQPGDAPGTLAMKKAHRENLTKGAKIVAGRVGARLDIEKPPGTSEEPGATMTAAEFQRAWATSDTAGKRRLKQLYESGGVR